VQARVEQAAFRDGLDVLALEQRLQLRARHAHARQQVLALRGRAGRGQRQVQHVQHEQDLLVERALGALHGGVDVALHAPPQVLVVGLGALPAGQVLVALAGQRFELGRGRVGAREQVVGIAGFGSHAHAQAK
jgi:photosystem II stability/assembly factor-like uncharacterized protein